MIRTVLPNAMWTNKKLQAGEWSLELWNPFTQYAKLMLPVNPPFS